MRFHIISLFPGMFESYLADSILARAQKSKKIKISFYNPRDYSQDKHKKVDDKPFGGGPGMVMTVDPVMRAVKKAQSNIKRYKTSKTKIIIFTPEKTPFTTDFAKKTLKEGITDFIMICGRYEGIDARVQQILGAQEVSVGDYVLTGGELPAMVVIDCVSRQIPGVLGKFESLEEERVSSHEVYTRPASYSHQGKIYAVPEVLQNGNHKEIDKWRDGK